MKNKVEESANKIYEVLEAELRGSTTDHAKAVISAVLARIGRVTIKDDDSRISVRSSTAVELINRLLESVKSIEKRGVDLSDDSLAMVKKLEGVRDTIRQSNDVTPNQQRFLSMASKDVVKLIRGARC